MAENRKIAISQRKKSSDYDEIGYMTAHLELDDSQMTKYENVQNSRWRMPPFQKSLSGHNSAADCPLTVQFCIWKQFFT